MYAGILSRGFVFSSRVKRGSSPNPDVCEGTGEGAIGVSRPMMKQEVGGQGPTLFHCPLQGTPFMDQSIYASPCRRASGHDDPFPSRPNSQGCRSIYSE